MSLAHVQGSPRDLTGNELWLWGFISVIDQCPLGESDPNWPDCAYIPVPLNQIITDYGIISATADPFTGTITGDEVKFTDREVQMEISQFVLYVIDMLVRFATEGQYQTLDDALTALIDCGAFRVAVENFLCNSLGLCSPAPYVEDACVGVRDELIDQLTEALLAITVDWEVMQFDQRAIAFDNPVDGNADKLGNPPAQPGVIENGDFEILFGADLEGTWWGTRP